jgi:hypothetical protein
MRAPLFLSLLVVAPLASALPAAPALTIYNQDFAVVRDTVALDLHAGSNDVRFADTTAQLEPDSVILRDPAGKADFQILEQNYRADPVSQALLLSLFEGKTIDFLVPSTAGSDSAPQIVQGKIVRSGYAPHPVGMARMNNGYGDNPTTGSGDPIIEVDGKLRFSLPGQPLFPPLADDAILKPTLEWSINSEQPAKFDAELAYVTGGMKWQADYSLVSPEKGAQIDLVGLVTIDNRSGKAFTGAKIKLMAGDVNKIQDQFNGFVNYGNGIGGARRPVAAPVTEKAFDEYHLYSLPRPTTLHDQETKQVEFVRAEGIDSQTIYIYDGANANYGARFQSDPNAGNDPRYGTQSNPKVWVLREFKNSEANHLGLPLPKGRVRFFRRDSDGQLEFTGENVIDHTPRDETLRLYTGDSFDLTGERKRVNYHIDNSNRVSDESYEIKVRNHKKEAVVIRVVEHLNRSENWNITEASDAWTKSDSQTIEFAAPLQPDEEKTLTYAVHYSW